MSDSEKTGQISAISQAIRAKRERKGTALREDIDALEAALIADIEAFDLDAAERRARREYLANTGAGMADPELVFPEIVPQRPAAPLAERTPEPPPVPELVAPEPAAAEVPLPEIGSLGLLDQLRRQAEIRQREIHSALTERTAINEAVDQALKHIFFFLHELVQQLNIVKPGIPRDYVLSEQHLLNCLDWQEGFADYRTQSQSAGALVELVTFSYHLKGKGSLLIERDGATVERFRTTLFDYGLPFTCKEFKNERQYVERAEFDIRAEVSVSARWRADFAQGTIALETRNLERLGSALHTLRPRAIDQALLDDFGRLVLGQPNRFRELAKR
ncbi:hypothetical protein LZ012_01910 [Dechloromonas sp. XY25]|uniref:Uncharacterized protein n=1 Tax=Dechloromonas hankyongensis TaxID=2908002 RepID=A0ABS9JXV7_9RHOO|nr:hypothetical protein [Dechloromonas hankyongensis]MCG2575745.1 hypothetical protein [Dechloromonas hankyongensis]